MVLRRGGRGCPGAACTEGSKVAVGSAAVDNRCGVLARPLSSLRFLKSHLQIKTAQVSKRPAGGPTEIIKEERRKLSILMIRKGI